MTRVERSLRWVAIFVRFDWLPLGGPSFLRLILESRSGRTKLLDFPSSSMTGCRVRWSGSARGRIIRSFSVLAGLLVVDDAPSALMASFLELRGL